MSSSSDSTPYNAYICDIVTTWFFHLINQPLQILDFGCGDGLLTYFMHRSFFNASLTGADQQPTVIQENKKKYPNLSFITLREPQLPFKDGSFDLIYAVNVMHHIPRQNHKKTIDELMRVLKPQGSLIIFENNPYNMNTHKRARETHCSLLMAHYLKNFIKKNSSVSVKISYLYPSMAHNNFMAPLLATIPLGSLYAVRILKN